MTRFETIDDPDYKIVLKDLQLLISKSERQGKKQDWSDPPRPLALVQRDVSAPQLSVQDIEIRLNLSVLRGHGDFMRPMESEAASSMLSISRFHNCKLSEYLRPVEHSGIVWAHLPTNNTLWVYPCFRNIADHYNLHLNLPSDWTRAERKSRKHHLHSRFMQPGCHITLSAPAEPTLEGKDIVDRVHQSATNATDQSGDSDEHADQADKSTASNSKLGPYRQLQLYLPYLHWDTTEQFAARSRYLDTLEAGQELSLPGHMTEETKAVLQSNRKAAVRNSYHPRRSLDQYGYPGLRDTSDRDSDQVISKNTQSAEDGEKMIMVDQLWLWVIEDDSDPRRSSMVFTCFPKNDREGPGDYADLQSSVVDSARERISGRSSAVELATLIVENAVKVMLDFQGEESLRFLEIFREAIAEAVSLVHCDI